MDLTSLGNLGEIIGAFAVVISLVYLATQVRHASRIAKVSSHEGKTIGVHHIVQMIAGNPEAADVFRRGLVDADDLSANDRFRFHWFMHTYLLHFKDVHEAYRLDVYDPETYEKWAGFTASLLNTPGGSRMWDDARATYVGEIVDRLESARESIPGFDVLAPDLFTDLTGISADE